MEKLAVKNNVSDLMWVSAEPLSRFSRVENTESQQSAGERGRLGPFQNYLQA